MQIYTPFKHVCSNTDHLGEEIREEESEDKREEKGLKMENSFNFNFFYF